MPSCLQCWELLLRLPGRERIVKLNVEDKLVEKDLAKVVDPNKMVFALPNGEESIEPEEGVKDKAFEVNFDDPGDAPNVEEVKDFDSAQAGARNE